MAWQWDVMHVVWLSGILLHIFLLAVLYACDRMRRFPLFTLYIFYFLFRSLGLFVLVAYAAQGKITQIVQSNVNIGLALGDIVLELAVLAGLAAAGLRDAKALRQRLLVTLGLGVLVAALLPAFWGRMPSLVTPGSTSVDWRTLLTVVISKGNLFVQAMAIVVALVVWVASKETALRWTNHVQRILHGLSFYAVVRIAVTLSIPIIERSIKQPTTMAEYQVAMQKLKTISDLQYMTVGAYLLAVAYWIYTLWMPDGPQPAAAAGAEVVAGAEIPSARPSIFELPKDEDEPTE